MTDIPENPNNPDEWFTLAHKVIADEGVFSQDQIAILQAVFEMIEGGVHAATKDLQRKPFRMD